MIGRFLLAALLVTAGTVDAGGSGGPAAQVNWPQFAADSTCKPPVENGTLRLASRPDSATSRRMQAIFDADQADRQGQIDWAKVEPRDRARELETMALLRGGKLASSRDLIGAAFVFQHGTCPNHFLLAHALADQAIRRGDRQPVTKFIYAATYDRWLLSTGKLQKYATQYLGDGDGCNMRLSATDPATTDTERTALGLPTLAEAEARASTLNQPNCKK